MSDYRRNYVPGGTYFFTVVTYQRRRMLTGELARSCLHTAIAEIQEKWPFSIVAIVLLPDHWHTIWTLPPCDDRYSLRLRRIKEKFTRRYLEAAEASWTKQYHGCNTACAESGKNASGNTLSMMMTS
jgi:putative transposase